MDKIKKEDIRMELKIMPISVKNQKLQNSKGKKHLERVDRSHIPKAAKQYKPEGKRTEEGREKDRLRPEQAYRLQP